MGLEGEGRVIIIGGMDGKKLLGERESESGMGGKRKNRLLLQNKSSLCHFSQRKI
jgi:hypothetical protein